MRILFLATDSYGGYGGIAQYNRDCIEAIAAMEGVGEVNVLQRIGKEQPSIGVEKVNLIGTIFNKYAYSIKAIIHALFNPPDIVFNAHIYHSGLSRLISRLFGSKIVSQLHGTEVWDPLAVSVVKTLMGSACVLCVSEDTKTRYLKQTQDPDFNNAVVQHNTVSDFFRLGDRALAREKFDLDDEKVLLSVGRLDPRKGGYKGHEQVLRTLPDMLVSGVNAKYLIAGIGEDEERLKRLVNEAGLNEVVEFLGEVAIRDLPDLYRAADLFVLPSTGEGFGIVYIEAMASGTLAMGLKVGGAPDALRDGELGICVDPELFSDTLKQTIKNLDYDRVQLATKTQERFCKAQFERNLTTALSPLIGSNQPNKPLP